MKKWLTAEERRTLAAVMAMIAAGYLAVGWRAWREPALPVTLDSLDLAFIRQGAEMSRDTLPESSAERTAARAAPARTPGPVDLNRADSLDLLELPGIGPAKAGAILAWRRRHGRFAKVEDLLEVGGIGPGILARLRSQVTLTSRDGGAMSPPKAPDSLAAKAPGL